MDARIRIGARGSPLALAQAEEVRSRLAAADPDFAAAGAAAIAPIHTTGDRMAQGPLSALGGKGLFTREIDEALRDRRIDAAVHSMKDMPTALPPGLAIGAVLPREDPRDAFLTADPDGGPAGPADLPPGAVVGTASLRRAALLRHRRPDLEIAPFRGNVGTRLRKLAQGEAAAAVLAAAGLRRLGLAHRARSVLPPEEMLPAAGQGIVAVQCRADDAALRARLAALTDAAAAAAAAAERALLAGLDGSCRTPIAALAEPDGDRLALRALIVRPDGTGLIAAARTGARADAEAMGLDAARELRARAGPDYFAAP